MQYQLKKLSAAVLALAFITACGSDDDDGGGITETAPAFVGSWTTGCVISPLPPAGAVTYFTYDVQFDATTWQYEQSSYLDEACTIQFQETDDTTSVRGTIAIGGTYLDSGEMVTTSDGLQANNLSLAIDSFTNTLAELGAPPNEAIGMTIDALVHVTDANVLFLDDGLLNINEAPGTLVLTLPFDQVQ